MSGDQAIPGHGLTPLEEKIMDLHDAGRRPPAIAAALGIPVTRVRSVVSTYQFSLVDRFEADARRGSAALLAAIERCQARRGDVR